jgi:CheY-like chemotaxis protein
MAKIPPDSRTVLIIEADADARATLAHLLQLHGYMVIAAGSDREALDELRPVPIHQRWSSWTSIRLALIGTSFWRVCAMKAISATPRLS